MDAQYLKLLIQKFWEGNASRQECIELFDLLDREAIAEDILSVGAEGPSCIQDDLLEGHRKEALLKKIATAIQSGEMVNGNESQHPEQKAIVSVRSMWIKRLAACAAIIALVFGSKVAFEYYSQSKSRSTVMAPQLEVAAVKIDTVLNPTDKIVTLALPDSSTVLLYPGSQICYESQFAHRNITLTGKAYFKVVHDINKVFTVTTGDIVTTDIGTEFEIDAQRKDKIAVHLVTGEVKVARKTGSSLQMEDQYLTKKGALLKINMTTDQVILERSSRISRANKEAKEALVFSKTPLATVFKRLGQQYKCNIEFKKTDLEKLTFTGEIKPDDPLENILNIICAINNLSFTKNGNEITISEPQRMR